MRTSLSLTVWAVSLVTTASAGQIVLPSTVLNRDSIATLTYRFDYPVTGRGQLSIRWTDSLHRLVEERNIPIELTDESAFTFPLDVRKAVAMNNTLHVHCSVDGKDNKGRVDRRDEDAQVDFVAKPPSWTWQDYVIIMWQSYATNLLDSLQKIGINASQVSGRSPQIPARLIEHNLRWYSESIAPDYYSAYHIWRPDRPYNWTLLKAKELYKQDLTSKEAFKRHPSFEDPVWRKTVHDRIVETAKAISPYRPYFYSLADEAGIGDLAGFWDFDFSDESLVPMRRWLHQKYGAIAALNEEWSSHFSSWDLVTPDTTHEAMARTDDNFSSWADLKQWMDISFADALRMGTDAVHEVDPTAYVEIGGGQMPSWGGYDYSRLTGAIDAIEPYDIGSNVEIIRSLAPHMPMLSTGFANSKWEQHRVWYELLHGHRGLIIWDENHEYVNPDGLPGTRGQDASAYYNEIRAGVGALLINSTPVADPIAIHYSQPSMRTEWMLSHRAAGDAWIARNAEQERSENDFLRLRESWCRLIEDQGMQYNFVSYQQVEVGELIAKGFHILVLPQSSALSQAEVAGIRQFIIQGGVVIADGVPGVFDENSRRLSKSSLDDLFGGPHAAPVTVKSFGKGKAIFLHTDTLNYLQSRLIGKEEPVHKLVGDLLHSNGIQPDFAVTDSAGKPVVGVELRVFRNGSARLISLIANPQTRVDELGPPDFKSNQRFEKPITVHLNLPEQLYLQDVRTGKSLGRSRSLPVTINPYEPVILSANSLPLAIPTILAPTEASRGSVVRLGFNSQTRAAEKDIFHFEVIDPHGTHHIEYSENVIADGGRGVKLIPLALNDPAGEWKIEIRDMLSGRTITELLTVN